MSVREKFVRKLVKEEREEGKKVDKENSQP